MIVKYFVRSPAGVMVGTGRRTFIRTAVWSSARSMRHYREGMNSITLNYGGKFVNAENNRQDSTEIRVQGVLKRMGLANIIAGVNKPRNIRTINRWIPFFSSQFFKTYLSIISSPMMMPVPSTGVKTRSEYVSLLRPLACNVRPTFPSVASLIGPIFKLRAPNGCPSKHLQPALPIFRGSSELLPFCFRAVIDKDPSRYRSLQWVGYVVGEEMSAIIPATQVL